MTAWPPLSHLADRAWQMIRLVRRWLSGREVVFVTDSSFAALEWLALVARLPHVSVITRLRLDAALYDPLAAAGIGTAMVAPASKGNVGQPWRQCWRTRRRSGAR